MAVLEMKRINVYALKKKRKAILEEIQRMGVIEIENLELKDNVFTKENTSQKQAVFLKSSASAGQAFKILDDYTKEKQSVLAMFEGREPISVENYYKYVDESKEIMRVAYDIIEESKKIAELKADILKNENQIEALLPWQDFDISMRFKGTNSTVAFIGSLQETVTYEDLIKKFVTDSNEDMKISLEIVSQTDTQTCIFIVSRKEDEEKVSEILRGLGFAKPTFSSKYVPKERIKELKCRIKNDEKSIKECEERIIDNKGMKNALKFIEDYFVMRSEKYEIIENLENTKHTFMLTGYIIADNATKLEKHLTQDYGAIVEIENIKENETAPVALKNNKLTAPVESVLETYSMPKKGEVDPTSIMAIFYYVFFGMMFSDAGYGLIMTIGCAFVLIKFKNMETGLKKSVQMFLGCGISTIFWGLMFGGFFGDALTIIASTFFNTEFVLQPLWFNPIEGSNSLTLLMVSFLFGIIHLFVGLGIQGYMHIKNGNPLSAIYDVLSWYLLVGGGILALLSLDLMKPMTGFLLPSYFQTIGGICAGIGAILIILFAGRGSKPGKRILKGVYGLYGATGYLSDILSYSRLLALGLATGVIAQVFNQIGAIMGGGVIGAILFIIVFIVGHSLNIGINALGAYVHTNRLQFVEFFGKFYEGGGEKFKPFKINTKHFKIKEEIFNG